MKIDSIELKWLGHSSFLIKDSKTIYIDPYNLQKPEEKADIILITHSHYDHCSIADIEKISKPGTKIIIPPDSQSKITRLNNVEMQIIEPGESIGIDKIKVQATPAYNKNKEFHPKAENWNGYILKIDNIIIYHAGDTDLIPEMEKLTGYGKQGNEFIALLPIGGKFTMNADEAAQAAIKIKPSLAIPMHYGAIIGTEDDAKRFKQLCEEAGVKAAILKKE